MRTVRILASITATPDIKSITTILFENLLPVLRRKVNVQMVWLVYQPEKLNLSNTDNLEERIIDIHNYKNAVEIIEREKPDIIYASPTWDLIDYALSLSGKFFNIPVVSFLLSGAYYTSRSSLTRLKLYTTRFFESYVPTDTHQNKKKFMKRGRFFIYKYLFLIRTQLATKMSILKIIQIFLLTVKLTLSDASYNPKFANTIHFLEDNKLQPLLLQKGFSNSSLIVTGNPMFDGAFQRSSNKNVGYKKDLISILLVPSTLYEHGFWTKKQKDMAITEIVKKITENKKEMLLVVKIHPSSSTLLEYAPIIKSIDSSIPVHQKGNVREYLDYADVIITYQSSTAEVFALIARKPIIICNFFSSKKDIFVERGIALECKNPDDLIQLIHKAMSHNYNYETNRDDFIKDFLYKGDGRAAERICDVIMKLFDKQNN